MENDVNALAVLAIHQIRYAEPDLVVVGVFDEGVGGGLSWTAGVRRGSNGRAMEIGHLPIGFPPGEKKKPPGTQEPGPKAPRQDFPISTLDVRAATSGTSTPSRPHAGSAECSATSAWMPSARSAPSDPGFEQAQDIFARSGAALGRALAHVSNTVNPSRVIAYLPGPLATPKPDTAAAAYLSAVRHEVTAHSLLVTSADYLTVRAFPAEPRRAALLGAKAAAVCVLESFIEHALRLDGCTTTLRRPARAQAA